MSICPSCGQDHHAVFVCAGHTLGTTTRKNPTNQSAAAKKRWKDYRHARFLAYHARQGQDPAPEPPPAPAPDPAPELKPSPNWRW
jgi:hypothetical protein